MRRVVEHRCPECDHLVSSTSRTRATVGRPFEECARCGAYVARTPYEESVDLQALKRQSAPLLQHLANSAGKGVKTP